MTRPLLAALVLALLVALAPATAAQAAPPDRTGRLLVSLDTSPGASFTRAAAKLLALDGLRRDGAQAPQIGLVSVRPVAGLALDVLAPILRRQPGVRAVEVERRATLRYAPNDPALSTPEPAAGTPAGTMLAWWVARSGLPAAWDVARGDGATVAVIDTGVDANHPELQGKIADTIDNDDVAGHGPPTSDENGHGTHVASLACGAGDNALGSVGSGLDCKLIVIKSDLSDGSVARSITQAADHGADAISMSFGNDGAAPQAIVDAVAYAASKGAIPVAAADDRPIDEQGYPANVTQPVGTGGDLATNRGLTVTAANFAGQRASFGGRGSQISLAAYGAFESSPGPAGIFAAFPGNPTQLESSGSLLFPGENCRCRTSLQGDSRFAYLQGTSMATPVVAGVAALLRRLNPDATVQEIIRALKQSAARPAGTGWNADLGWGIVDAGAAVSAVRAIDHRAPTSKLTGRTRVRKARSVTLRWSGTDTAAGGLVPSGVDVYEVYRSANRGRYRRLKRTRTTQLKLKVKPGSVYRFYTVAVDKAGNREAVPKKPDLSLRADRR